MTTSNKTFQAYVMKMGGTHADEFIADPGELFYDPESSDLRIGDGVTPGGTVIGGGSANTGDFTFSNTTISAPQDMNISVGDVEFLGYIDNGLGDDSGATLHVTSVISGTITDGMTVYSSDLPPEGWTLTFGTVVSPQGSGGVGNYYLSGANYQTTNNTFTGPVKEWTFDINGNITMPGGGTLVYTSASSNGAIIADTSNAAFSVATDDSFNIPNFSGMLLVNDHYDGGIALYIAGGGSAVLVSNTNSAFDTNLSMENGGYTWTNSTGLTGPFTFTVIKTRDGS